jgi:hypothetical protein
MRSAYPFPGLEIWRNFITKDKLSIIAPIADGVSSNKSDVTNPPSLWPSFNIYGSCQINLNETGDVPFSALNGAENLTEYMGLGLMNGFTLANAYS